MNRGILVALVLTLLAVAYVSMQEEDPSDATAADVRTARPGVSSAAAPPEPTGNEGIARAPVRTAANVTHDLFASHSFLPPPPRLTPEAAAAAAAASRPPAPVAPPLPFRYQGRMVEGDSTVVFLTQGDRMLIARKGDLLNNQYRVESVSASAVTFMYEPLKQRQTLSIGSAK